MASRHAWVWLLCAFLVLLTGCWGNHVQPLVPAATVVPPKGSVGDSFVMFSDAQQFPIVNAFARGGPRERRLVRERIRALSPDLILYGGDAVGYGTYEPFWEEFSHDYAGMTMYPVIGNHDLYGSDERALEYFFTAFPHLHGARWYDLRFGPMLILLLDSNRDNLGDKLWETEQQWLDRQLEMARDDRTVGLVVLISHHPPMSTSSGGGKRSVLEAFYNRAAANPKFKLHLCGHHHAYQHIVDGERHVLVAGGGGGPLYYRQNGTLPGSARMVTGKNAHHVVRGVLEKDRLRVEMHELGAAGGWTIPEVFVIPLANYNPAP